MRKLCFAFLLFFTTVASAQHTHGGDSIAMSSQQPIPSSALYPFLEVTSEGSGTSWIPEFSPMHAWHMMAGEWMVMVHGNLAMRYTSQDVFTSGTRGLRDFSAPNWLMLMSSRRAGPLGLMLRGMLSVDRLTEGGDGYPLLFQTGETWDGRRLVDRQHPHDLFMELAVGGSFILSEESWSSAYLYLGLPGEPALGPAAFMHRPSAMGLPDAPLGHHWQDATHISYGVVTAGIVVGKTRLEGSAFNGFEPDENRVGFDTPKLNSYSVRISTNHGEAWSLQLSQGFLKSPEALEPGVDVRRTTASLHYHDRSSRLSDGLFSSLIWGLNAKAGGKQSHSLLLESTCETRVGKYFGRMEALQKEAIELELTDFEHDRLFWIPTASLGASYKLVSSRALSIALGSLVSVARPPQDLRTVYGNWPVSLQLFLSASAPRH